MLHIIHNIGGASRICGARSRSDMCNTTGWCANHDTSRIAAQRRRWRRPPDRWTGSTPQHCHTHDPAGGAGLPKYPRNPPHCWWTGHAPRSHRTTNRCRPEGVDVTRDQTRPHNPTWVGRGRPRLIRRQSRRRSRPGGADDRGLQAGERIPGVMIVQNHRRRLRHPSRHILGKLEIHFNPSTRVGPPMEAGNAIIRDDGRSGNAENTTAGSPNPPHRAAGRSPPPTPQSPSLVPPAHPEPAHWRSPRTAAR